MRGQPCDREMGGSRAHQSSWHLGARGCVCAHAHRACMCASMVCRTPSCAVRPPRTGSELRVTGRAFSSATREGCLPSLGAAGCRWSDITFYSASHLVAALAGRNSPRASSELCTSPCALPCPSSDPQTGLCAATSTLPSESVSQSGGQRITGFGIRSTGGHVLAPLGTHMTLSELLFAPLRPSVTRPLEG